MHLCRRIVCALSLTLALISAGCARGLPPLERNAPATRVLIGAGTLSAEAPDRLTELARAHRAAALVTLEPGAGSSAPLWRRRMMPADGAAPASSSSALLSSFRVGAAHFCLLDSAAPVAEGDAVALALINDLSLTRSVWKILLLARPIVSKDVATDLDYFGRLLEREGTLLAVSPGATGYERSRPIGVAPAGAVRYIALPATAGLAPTARPWLARTLAEGDYVLLDFTSQQILWRLYDRSGRLLDALEVHARDRAASATGLMTYGEIFAAAAASSAPPSEAPPSTPPPPAPSPQDQGRNE